MSKASRDQAGTLGCAGRRELRGDRGASPCHACTSTSVGRSAHSARVGRPSWHPIPPWSMPVPSVGAGQRRLGLKVFGPPSIAMSGSALSEARIRLGLPSSSSVAVAGAPAQGRTSRRPGLKRSVLGAGRYCCGDLAAAVLALADRSALSVTRRRPRWRSRRSSRRPSISLAGSTTASRGIDPCRWDRPQDLHFHGDHDMNCEGPTTLRDVAFGGTPSASRFLAGVLVLRAGWRPGEGSHHDRRRHDRLQHRLVLPQADVHRRDRRCAGTSTRPMMSSPEVDAGAVRRPGRRDPLPAGTITFNADVRPSARGTGGFDLGFTSPDFRDPNGRPTGFTRRAARCAG